MVATSPKVATPSASHCPIPVLAFVETCTKSMSNIAWASTAPVKPPATWTMMYNAAVAASISRRTRNAAVTAGLKCAPEIRPSMVINTARMAPVASVLPSRATASLPSARFSAMIPEPTTVASSSSVPRASAANLRDNSTATRTLLRNQRSSVRLRCYRCVTFRPAVRRQVVAVQGLAARSRTRTARRVGDAIGLTNGYRHATSPPRVYDKSLVSGH